MMSEYTEVKLSICTPERQGDAVFRCGKLLVYSDGPVDRSLFIDGEYYVAWVRRDGRPVLLDFRPVPRPGAAKVDAVIRDQGTLLVNVDYGGKTYKAKLDVDVVSIDDKSYFIPREFFAFQPVQVASNIRVEPGVGPSVQYRSLMSGLYVPVEYVSEGAMKRLEDLDDQYSVVKMMGDFECGSSCSDYQGFKEFYRKRFDVVAEQAKVIVEELEKRKFKFEVRKVKDRYAEGAVVEVNGPGGRGTFRAAIDRSWSHKLFLTDFRGKWALIGVAVYNLYKLGLWTEVREHRVPKDMRDWVLSYPVQGNGGKVFNVWGAYAVPIADEPTDTFHPYFVRHMKLGREVHLAISYAPAHGVGVSQERRTTVIDGNTVQFGRDIYYCRFCKAVLDEVPINGS